MKFVIDRNGQRTVFTGWRAWLVVAPALVLSAFVLVAIVWIILGLALTVTTIVLIGLPLAFVFAAILQLVRPLR